MRGQLLECQDLCAHSIRHDRAETTLWSPGRGEGAKSQGPHWYECTGQEKKEQHHQSKTKSVPSAD